MRRHAMAACNVKPGKSRYVSVDSSRQLHPGIPVDHYRLAQRYLAPYNTQYQLHLISLLLVRRAANTV